MLFGNVICELCQCLGRTYADTHRQSRPLSDALPDLLTVSRRDLPFKAGQIEKAFIDGIDFLIGAEHRQDAHDAVAHVGIQRIVGRISDDAVLSGKSLS